MNIPTALTISHTMPPPNKAKPRTPEKSNDSKMTKPNMIHNMSTLL